MVKSICKLSSPVADHVIEVNHLTKSYSGVQALKDVTLDVHHGELFGLIGPDGAGKTTLFRLLTTLMDPDAGEARVNGWDIRQNQTEIRSSVGYMPGRFSLYQDLTVEENLNFFASVFGVKVAENYHLVAPVYHKLELFKKRRAGKLSGGMKQKLALCCALIHNPSVLFLDEPTTGVDAVSRTEFWEMLLSLKQDGMTILVSTPYMDEASLCDRIALIDKGRILGMDTPQAIVENEQTRLFEVSANEMYRLLEYVRQEPGVKMCYPFGAVHHLVTDDSFDVAHLMQCLQESHFQNISLEQTKATIEDVFIRLMK